MEILRTPDSCFDGLVGYPFEPHYTDIKTSDGTQMRIHHIDEGPKDGPVLLCMHGQPVWSYLYSRMIPYLTEAGIRVICPDLPGYGKSDKPSMREDYSYQNQVDWMNAWLQANAFENLTFFGQDWGGLIGLRMIADLPQYFAKVSIGNTGLPYNPDVSQETIDAVNAFMQSDIMLTPMSMAKQINQMGEDGADPALRFMYWQKFCWDTVDLPIGLIAMQALGESISALRLAGYYMFHRMGMKAISPFANSISKAFEAPFLTPAYKMGPRAMPSHVPILPDSSLEAQAKAIEFYKTSDKPFLIIFAGDDPVTNGIEASVKEMAPNATTHPHIGGGHFFQWNRPKQLSEALISFIVD